MACEVIVAKQASDDLDTALLYLKQSLFAPDAAKSLLDAFAEFVDSVAEFPLMYPVSDEPRLNSRGYRKALLEGYVALYMVDDQKVYVLHLFHQSQDYAALV